jgi:hypothetical protein
MYCGAEAAPAAAKAGRALSAVKRRGAHFFILQSVALLNK